MTHERQQKHQKQFPRMFVLLGATAATIMTEPRPGQEGMEVPVILALSAAFVAVHALHLWLISKMMNSSGS